MRIGVTGASGMVGINVCKEILSNGDELNILIREDVSYLDGLSCNKFYGDLSDIDTLEKSVSYTHLTLPTICSV